MWPLIKLTSIALQNRAEKQNYKTEPQHDHRV